MVCQHKNLRKRLPAADHRFWKKRNKKPDVTSYFEGPAEPNLK